MAVSFSCVIIPPSGAIEFKSLTNEQINEIITGSKRGLTDGRVVDISRYTLTIFCADTLTDDMEFNKLGTLIASTKGGRYVEMIIKGTCILADDYKILREENWGEIITECMKRIDL